ncbi:tape measure protein [Romboutsia ilealis]|uniref:tape measure protein n=1 Tax=Romboutsia ilealis TaxID=1115758 RepID=UPI00257319C6|nr:tape measure protein [Romboutsia ilealis]
MATIGELWVNLNAKTDNFDKGIDKASNKANSLGGVISKVGQNIASFMLYDVGKNLVTGFINATKAGIDYNATLETSSIKWETLLGSQEKANKMLKDIEKFAATTPFEKMGVEAMATQLHNAGFEGQSLFDQLTKFGDLSGAFGIQSDSLQEMVRQYAQVKQAGVAYTEDLNILQDRGIPIYKALAEELGINTADVKKWASEGKISADIYQSALDNLASSVEGGMVKQSKSFSGMVSTLKDNMSQAAGILAQPIFDKLKQGLENILPYVENVISSLSENGLMGTIQRFAPGIEPFVQTAIAIFQTMGDTVGTIIQSLTSFWDEHGAMITTVVSFAWNFIAGFIMSTITAIGNVVQSGLAVIDGIINFFQNLFQGNFQGCWESIKQIFSNAIKFIWNWMQVQFAVNIPNMIKNFAKNIPMMITNMWASIKGFFSGGISACINFIKNLVSTGTSNFNTLRTFGANAFQALWSVAKTMMSNLLSAVTSSIRQVPTTVKNFMTQAVNVIKNINLVQVGRDMIQGLINGIKGMASNVVGAIKGVVSGAVNAAKKALGINSPSKVFKQFGAWTGEGLALGIEGENNNVSKASRSLASSVIGGYDVSLNGIKTDISRNTSMSSEISNVGNQEGSPIIINIDGREVFRVMSPYMGKASRGW